MGRACFFGRLSFLIYGLGFYMMRKMIFISVAFFGASVSAAGSLGNTNAMEISSIGCHVDKKVCYVYIDAKYGPETCSSVSLRWNKDSSVSGKETLSLLMMAFASGKRVRFNISDACLGSYPTFNYFSIIK